MSAHDKERDEFEGKNLGGYEQILPSKNPKYKEYLDTAKKVWTAFNSSNLRKDEIEKLKTTSTEIKKKSTS